MWTEDLLPYRELHRQVPFVMVAHACYPEVTKEKLPASLSRKWMTDILRKKIGYRGLIVSDDLEMGGVLSAGPIEEIAVQTLRAGADIFLVCHNQELVWRSYEAVLREAERDRRFAALISQAARRVLNFKKRSGELRGFASAPKASVIEKLRQLVLNFSDLTAAADSSRRFPEVPA
jgi:beta-N-acetylhexosaminidase